MIRTQIWCTRDSFFDCIERRSDQKVFVSVSCTILVVVNTALVFTIKLKRFFEALLERWRTFFHQPGLKIYEEPRWLQLGTGVYLISGERERHIGCQGGGYSDSQMRSEKIIRRDPYIFSCFQTKHVMTPLKIVEYVVDRDSPSPWRPMGGKRYFFICSSILKIKI